MRISFPNLNKPAKIWIIPANTTVANIYSGQSEIAKAANYNWCIAPVAPEIIPGRPPKIEVTNPTTNAA
jgi:hypothetical protein